LLARSERDVAWLGRLVIPLGALSAAGLAVIIVVRHGLDAGDPWTQSAGYLLLGILFGAMVVGAVSGRTGPALDRLYRSAPLRMLGRYSYGLYVLEALTILFMSWLFAEVGDARLVLGSRLPEILAYCAATGVLTVVVAVASWHLYEQQFLKLKRHFPRSRAAPAADVRVLPSHVSGTAAATTPN
jgi:peptidoglycan/LPS O-acetylase OafA/YrhL